MGTRTYSVPWLLHEELGEADHLRVAVERLGEVYHGVGGVLLVAVATGGEKTGESSLGERIAFVRSTGGELMRELMLARSE